MNALVLLLVVVVAAPLGSAVAWAVAAAERPASARPVAGKALGLCESCRLRPAVVVVDADGEPFAVCESCSTGGAR